MNTQDGQPKDKVATGGDPAQKELLTPLGKLTSLAKQAACDHDWQIDGQTYTAVRWICTKCFKTKLSGVDI